MKPLIICLFPFATVDHLDEEALCLLRHLHAFAPLICRLQPIVQSGPTFRIQIRTSRFTPKVTAFVKTFSFAIILTPVIARLSPITPSPSPALPLPVSNLLPQIFHGVPPVAYPLTTGLLVLTHTWPQCEPKQQIVSEVVSHLREVFLSFPSDFSRDFPSGEWGSFASAT